MVTPTGVVSSKAARVRSNSNRSRATRRSSADHGEVLKACSSTLRKPSSSCSSIGRTGYGLLADWVMVPYVPPHAPSALMNLARLGLDRIQCPHHDFRAAAETSPSGSSTRAALGVHPAHAADQAVHHQEPPDGLRPLGADDRHRGGFGACVRVVVLARRDDLADPGRRPAAVAPGAAHLLRVRRGGRDLRRGRGQGRGRDRRHHRAHRGLRRRTGADQGEARRPGPARRPDAARAAGPHPGPGQAARTRRGLGVVPGAQAGRRLLVRRRLRGVVLRRQDARGRARRRVRQGHRRGDQGAAALRRVRRAARLGAQGGVPACLQRLHAPRRGQRGFRHRRAPLARPGDGGVHRLLGRRIRRPCTTTARRAAGG